MPVRFDKVTHPTLRLLGAVLVALASSVATGVGTASAATQVNVTLTANPSNPTYPSGAITLIASLDQSVPGTVAFAINGTLPYAPCSSQTVDTTVTPAAATCPYTPSGAGSFTVNAQFTPTDTVTYSSPPAPTLTVTVNPGTPVLNLSASPPSPVYGQATTLTATSSVAGTFGFTDNGGSIGCDTVATSGSGPYQATCPWTPTSATSQTIVATFTTPDSNYVSGGTYSLVVNVGKANQAALSLTSTAGVYGTPLQMTTSGGTTSGPVSYIAADESASGCAISSGSLLSSSSAGTCSVTATMAGDSNYNAVSSPSTTVTFAKANQATLFVASTAGTYGASLTLTTSGGSGTGPVAYTVLDGSATGCVITSMTSLSATSAGTCLVTATQAGDGNYNAASSAQTAVTFAKAGQAGLTLTSTAGTYGTPLTLTANGGSGTGAVTFNVSGGSGSGCVISGNSLSSQSAGICLVTATKASDGNFRAATSPTTVVTFAEAPQLALSLDPVSGTYGRPLGLSTTGGSGNGAITYAVSNGSATGCQVSGGSLTATSAGTCTVTAIKANDGNYLATNSSPTTVNFGKALQLPLTLAPATGTFGKPLTLSARGGSGEGSLVYVAHKGTAAGCHVAGNKLTVSSSGTCVVTATKGATVNYLSATSNRATFSFKAAHSVNLSLVSTSGTFGSPIALATAGGRGTGVVHFFVTNGTASACQILGSSLHATTAGTCLVRATKAGDGKYRATASPLTVVTFARANQAPLGLATTRGTFGVAVPLLATGGSGAGAVSFQVSDLTATGCAITRSATHLVLRSKSAGTCVVKVTRAADRNYLSRTSPPTPVIFSRSTQAPLSILTTSARVGHPLTLRISGGNGTGRLVFTVSSKDEKRCRVSGGVLVAAAGTCHVSVLKEGDRNYLSRRSPADTITISALTQKPFLLFPARATAGSGIALVTRGGSGHGRVHFALRGGSSTTCALRGTELVSQSAGTCRVIAFKAGTGAYQGVRSVVVTFLFTPKALHVSLSVSSTVGLRNGQKVVVTARGFAPNENVVIAQCTLNASSLSQCDRGTLRTVVAGASGMVPATVLTLATGQIGQGSCATSPQDLDACEIYVSGMSIKGTASVPLHFAPVTLQRTLRVSPSTHLHNGQVVTLSGYGFAPNQRIYYAECLSGPITQTRCDLATIRSVVTSSTGVFPTTTIRLKAGLIGPSTCGTNSSDLGACVISVANSKLGDVAVVHLTFALP